MTNGVNVKLNIPGRPGKGRVVHVNNCKEFKKDTVMVASEVTTIYISS